MDDQIKPFVCKRLCSTSSLPGESRMTLIELRDKLSIIAIPGASLSLQRHFITQFTHPDYPMTLPPGRIDHSLMTK